MLVDLWLCLVVQFVISHNTVRHCEAVCWSLCGVLRMESSRKWKRDDACSIYLMRKSRKAHNFRPNLEEGLQTNEECTSSMDTDRCFTCLPVLALLKPAFLSLTQQGAELRHSKCILPNPKKWDKQHYRNSVAQSAWIRANLFDALGNYKYCSACIINTLGIGSRG